MRFDPASCTVYRLRWVAEPTDLGPLFARFPLAHPERICALEALQMSLGEAKVTIAYANRSKVLGTVLFDADDWVWEVSAVRFVRGQPLDRAALYMDLPLAAVAPLVGDIGRSVREPDWRGV